MKALKLSLGIVFLFLLIFSNKAFSSFEELIAFKKNHSALILENNFVEISDYGKILKENKKRQKKSGFTELLASIEKVGLPEAWVRWFRSVYEKRPPIDVKEFAAAIFYPYEILATTHKRHISQMNYAFKASIMYSAELDSSGPGRITRNSLKRDIGVDISSEEQLLLYLDLGLIVNSPVFLEKIQIYESSQPTLLSRLIPYILSSGTAIQTLNLGFLLNHFEREDEALEAFRIAGIKGSMRAKIEEGKILLKRDFYTGVGFFRSLGAYGLWKVAQCYRYGVRNIGQNYAAANAFYLEALATGRSEPVKYPELFFDVADFAVFYAYSQPDPNIFQAVIKNALEQFIEAGGFHLGSAFLKAAEVSLDAVGLFPQLATDPSYTEEFRREKAKAAFREGQVAKVTSFAKKNSFSIEGASLDEKRQMTLLRSYAEQIDRYFGF